MLAAVPAAVAADGRSPPRVPYQQVLQRTGIPGTNYAMLLMRVQFPPNYVVERHSHPGPQASHVLAGGIVYQFDGREPDERQAGESIEIPGYAIHGAKAGAEGAVLLNTFVVEMGKPISLPAAPPRL